MWLLIITIIGYGDGSSGHSSSIEFSTKESCILAQKRVIKHPLDIRQYRQYIDAFCAKK